MPSRTSHVATRAALKITRRRLRTGNATIVVLVAVPILLIGGVVGAGLTGLVQIPGLTPQRKAAKLYATDSHKEETKAGTSSPTIPPASATEDPQPQSRRQSALVVDPAKLAAEREAGAKRVARLWNNLDVSQLVPMVADWSDQDLAYILAFMEPEKAASVLGALDPKRASRLSREMQKPAPTR